MYADITENISHKQRDMETCFPMNLRITIFLRLEASSFHLCIYSLALITLEIIFNPMILLLCYYITKYIYILIPHTYLYLCFHFFISILFNTQSKQNCTFIVVFKLSLYLNEKLLSRILSSFRSSLTERCVPVNPIKRLYTLMLDLI